MIHTEQKSMKVKLLLVYISAQFNSMHEKCFHSNEERAVLEIQQKTMQNINRESQIFRQICLKSNYFKKQCSSSSFLLT